MAVDYTHSRTISVEGPDKNGTLKETVEVPCDRCGGKGKDDIWKHSGYTCFKCMGSCVMTKEVIIRTPEYQRKLDKIKAKKDFNKRQKAAYYAVNKVAKKLGTYNLTDKYIYISLQFVPKEEKRMNYHPCIGAYFLEPNAEYKTVRVSTEDIWYVDVEGLLYFTPLCAYIVRGRNTYHLYDEFKSSGYKFDSNSKSWCTLDYDNALNKAIAYNLKLAQVFYLPNQRECRKLSDSACLAKFKEHRDWHQGDNSDYLFTKQDLEERMSELYDSDF